MLLENAAHLKETLNGQRDATERMFRASVEEGEGEPEGWEVGEKMHQSVQSEKRISLGNNNNNNKQNIWRRRRRRSSIWPNGMCANCLMGQEATDALPSSSLPVPTPCSPSAPPPPPATAEEALSYS